MNFADLFTNQRVTAADGREGTITAVTPTGFDIDWDHNGGDAFTYEAARAANIEPTLSRRPTIAMARVATAHFEFVTFAHTPDEARDLLMRAWYLHADDTAADPDYVRRDDINVVVGDYGQAFRDGRRFPSNL
jgi:hypothetical protein